MKHKKPKIIQKFKTKGQLDLIKLFSNENAYKNDSFCDECMQGSNLNSQHDFPNIMHKELGFQKSLGSKTNASKFRNTTCIKQYTFPNLKNYACIKSDFKYSKNNACVKYQMILKCKCIHQIAKTKFLTISPFAI